MISLAGCASSGKSTLAKAYADKYSWAFIESPALDTFRMFGFSLDQKLDFKQRMAVQWDILRRLEDLYVLNRGALFISARSPIDLMVYTLSELPPQGTPEEDAELEWFAAECFRVLNNYTSMVLFVPAALDYEDSDKRPAYDPAKLQLQENLFVSLLGDCRVAAYPVMLMRENTKLETRLSSVDALWAHLLEETSKQLKGQTVH